MRAEIDEAAMVKRMVLAESVSAGIERAIASVASAIGVGRWTVWRIYHGRRKDFGAGLIRKVRLAYVGHCERQLKKLEAELLIAKMRCGDDPFSDLDREIAALAARVASARARTD